MISASLLSDSPAANFPVLPYTQTEMKGEDKDKTLIFHTLQTFSSMSRSCSVSTLSCSISHLHQSTQTLAYTQAETESIYSKLSAKKVQL